MDEEIDEEVVQQIVAEMEDSDEVETDGDVDLGTVDRAQLAVLRDGIAKVEAAPENEKDWAALGFLHQMYGDDLVVI